MILNKFSEKAQFNKFNENSELFKKILIEMIKKLQILKTIPKI